MRFFDFFRDFVIWWHEHFFYEMPRNQWISFLVTFSFHKTSHVLLLEMPPPSSTVRNLRNAPFFYLENQMGEWDISRFLNVEKWGISRRNHVINLKTGKESKMNVVTLQLTNAVTWQNPHSHAFWGISWYFPYELQMQQCAPVLTKTQSRIK